MQTLSQQDRACLIELLRRSEPRLYYALEHHRTTAGERLRFHNRPYVLPIYNDNSKDIVIMKSVQCGITEWLIIETFNQCDKGRSVFYVLPKYDLRNTFVANRIDKLINVVPLYREMLRYSVGDSDSKSIKHISSGTVKFASSNTMSDFLEFPADVLIIDELDLCDQGNLPFAKDRIKASPHKLTRKVANPRITGVGISDEFKNSDQKEWMVKCDSCGTYQELDFFKVVVEERIEGDFVLRDKEWTKDSGRDIHCICAHCNKSFNRLSHTAYWERKNPGHEVSGYHISRLMEPETTVKELWDTWQAAQGDETKKQAFHNSDLGIPYESRGAKLSDLMLDKCVNNYSMPSSAEDTIMGVDIGSVLHVHISSMVDGKRKKLFIGTVPTFEEVDNLIKIFGVAFGVVDALPETHEAKKLRDRFPGKIWLCTFHSTEGNPSDMRLKDEEHGVVVDRTQIFDETHADIIKQKVMYPRDAKSIDHGQFYEQMKAPTRVKDEEKSRYVWREGTKKDHYRLADVYEKVAYKIYQERNPFFGTTDRDFSPDN